MQQVSSFPSTIVIGESMACSMDNMDRINVESVNDSSRPTESSLNPNTDDGKRVAMLSKTVPSSSIVSRPIHESSSCDLPTMNQYPKEVVNLLTPPAASPNSASISFQGNAASINSHSPSSFSLSSEKKERRRDRSDGSLHIRSDRIPKRAKIHSSESSIVANSKPCYGIKSTLTFQMVVLS
jgi:hypothetical protein